MPHEVGQIGVPAVLRYVHAAGAQARLALEVVSTREQVDVEISRAELAGLNLKLNDLVMLRLRPLHTFQQDYSI